MAKIACNSTTRGAARTAKPRQCSGCTACCTVMAVGSIGKSAGTECVHACASGCSIYPNRPQQCKSDFTCIWLADRKNLLGEVHRPDRIGLVLTEATAADGSQAIAARELFAGAAAAPAAKQLIQYLKQFVAVFVVSAKPRPFVPLTLTASRQPA